MKENKIITDIEELTPEWLTHIFKKKGYLSQGKVTKIIEKKTLEHYSSIVHFLEVSFSTDAQTEPDSSESHFFCYIYSTILECKTLNLSFLTSLTSIFM